MNVIIKALALSAVGEFLQPEEMALFRSRFDFAKLLESVSALEVMRDTLSPEEALEAVFQALEEVFPDAVRRESQESA